MSEQQRDTAFLTRLISYDDSAKPRELAERIARLQGDERCVKRAACVVAVCAGLAIAGVCYAAVFLLDPMNAMRFLDQFLIRILCAVAVGSLICLTTFLLLGAFYRMELARHREECRCLALKIIEERVTRNGFTS
jgi:hypothetical protein